MSRRECESIRPLISAFFDGDLAPSESVRLHQHLATCADCRQIVDEYQRIRSDLHQLPPTPVPPDHLANKIWSETVQRPAQTGLRRVFGATTAKIGLSTVAAVAILAVISAFLLVRGYNQGMTPSIVSSTPVSAQNWPIYQPVKIEFNKEMNHASVEENLQIWPPGERDRIPTSWDGNTLILGASSAQNTLFLPDTAYQVMVLSGAQDAFGHQIGKTWSLSFRTSPVSNTALGLTPTPTVTKSPTSTAEPAQGTQVANAGPSPSTSGAPAGTIGGTSTTNQGTGPAATAQPATPPASQSPVSSPPAETLPATPVATAPATPAASQPTATQPATTPTPVITPTAAPSTPQPTASSSPTATQPPAGTPTATVLPVTGAFGSVYWANTTVQTKLGAALGTEVIINASELGFQRGTMYERFDTGEIYVFFANGQWIKAKDTWHPSDGEGGGAGPDAGLWIPKESFWKVWNSDPSLASSIGYAVEQDAHLMTKSGGSFQTFANGIMLYSDRGFVYVVYDDGTWALFPDTSGHGDLLTPTPDTTGTVSPAETPAQTPASSTATPAGTPTP